MATRYWIGGTTDHTTDWATAANWSGASVPVTNDTVIFDGRSTYSCTSGMDQTGVDLTKMHVMSSYTGTIGAANGPLIIECSGNMIIQGSGNYYIQCGNDANDADIAKLIIDASSSSTIGLSSQKNASAGNVAIFTTIIAQSGTIYLYGNADTGPSNEDGTAFGTLYIVPLNGRDRNVTVYIGDQCEDYKNSALGSIYMYNGTLYLYSDVNVLFQAGGSVYNGGTNYSMDAGDDNITTLHLCGGTFYWKPSVVVTGAVTTASASPAITTANLYGGKFDASDMQETLTTAPTITTLNQYNTSDVNFDNGYGNIVATTWNRFGGSQSFSTGQSVTIS